MLKVLKFGGTSVGSAENMVRVGRIVGSEGAKIVVLSAMSGTTDMLVKLSASVNAGDKAQVENYIGMLVDKYGACALELFKEGEYCFKANKKINSVFRLIIDTINDYRGASSDKIILAQGELLTSFIFALYMEKCGVKVSLLNAPDYIVISEDKAPCVASIKERMKLIPMDDDTLYVTQGFICSFEGVALDNLGRGGSDYSAALFGAAIGASEIQIWTDIDGMHNNDPRFVENTYPVRTMLFDEAAELAYFGAKILHPATILPCKDRGISVRLKNSMDPSAPGTLITDNCASERDFVAVAAKDNITIIRITSTNMLMAYGFLRKVFEVFERYKTPIDMIATSEVAVSLTIDSDCNLAHITGELSHYGHIEVQRDNTIVCVVGNVGYQQAGLIARIMDSITSIPVRMISYGASNRSISFLIDTSVKKSVLNKLNTNLF